MKKHWLTIMLIAVLVIGLSLVLYPTIADWWNSYRQTQSVANYVEQVANINDETYQKILDTAHKYNEILFRKQDLSNPSESQLSLYQEVLNVDGSGIIGYIEIDKINVSLPIYHGTNDSALQIAIGHLEWSSMPVGGENTHCVLSGHRGLPSARLFTDLDKMEIGDTFTICVLDEIFTYEVDQIKIVLPHEVDDLSIEYGKDYCTLTTCTPYGINTHRMLVRGHRVENIDNQTVRVTADAMHVKPIIVAPFVAIPMLLLLFIILMLPKKSKRRINYEK
jgi:sortase A